MKKNIIFILVSFILFTGCQRNEVIKTHGISYLEKREKLIIVNQTNKNDTISDFGQPATSPSTINTESIQNDAFTMKPAADANKPIKIQKKKKSKFKIFLWLLLVAIIYLYFSGQL